MDRGRLLQGAGKLSFGPFDRYSFPMMGLRASIGLYCEASEKNNVYTPKKGGWEEGGHGSKKRRYGPPLKIASNSLAEMRLKFDSWCNAQDAIALIHSIPETPCLVW